MPSTKEILFVAIQLVMFVIFLIDVEFFEFEILGWISGFFAGIGTVGALLVLVALIQLNTKISPFPSPMNRTELLTTIAFKATRHPIYTGIFIALLCYGIAMGSGWKIFVSLLLLTLFHYKSLYEEELLKAKFPEYTDYQKETGRLFPKF